MAQSKEENNLMDFSDNCEVECDPISSTRCVKCHSSAIVKTPLKCGHRVCQHCKRYFKNDHYVCGYCLLPVGVKTLIPKPQKREIMVRCPNDEFGCPARLPLNKIQSHLEKCSFTDSEENCLDEEADEVHEACPTAQTKAESKQNESAKTILKQLKQYNTKKMSQGYLSAESNEQKSNNGGIIKANGKLNKAKGAGKTLTSQGSTKFGKVIEVMREIVEVPTVDQNFTKDNSSKLMTTPAMHEEMLLMKEKIDNLEASFAQKMIMPKEKDYYSETNDNNLSLAPYVLPAMNLPSLDLECMPRESTASEFVEMRRRMSAMDFYQQLCGPNSAGQFNSMANFPILYGPSAKSNSSSSILSICGSRFNGISGKYYNILLLGQTGVGKSTFINAFCNYLKYNSLDEARDGDTKALIACHFTLPDENYKSRTIFFGSDDNENMQRGQSSTQKCKAYEFPVDNFTLRIIDTPGIGDTRGIQHDRSNLDGMLEFISNYDELYAICILLKPNESRLTPFFAFCIKQLLCHLHQKASKNIVFIFTNSRSTFYRPGDTVTPLTEILDQIRGAPPYPNIPFGKENIFCLDNESFRFLIALQNGIKFNETDFQNFGQSWLKSVEESTRMIRHIVEGEDGSGATPHLVLETLVVNEVRQAIVNLSQPLSEIAKNIQLNIKVLNERKEEINDSTTDKNKLKQALYMPKITLNIKEMSQPCTVCTGDKCRQPYKMGNLINYHYPQKCHNPCYLTEVPKEIVGYEGLQYCWAMNQSTNTCRICGCHYKKHLHIYYESEEVETKVVDSNIQSQLNTKKGMIKAAKEMVARLENEIDKYKLEEKTLSKYTAKLAIYLKQNAMVVCNDSFKEHLMELIENEKSLNSRGSNNCSIISGLQDMLCSYEREKTILDFAINRSGDNNLVSLEEVYDIIEKIANMEKVGVTFTCALTAQRRTLAGTVQGFFSGVKKSFFG